MEIKEKPIAELKLAKYNPRTISDKDLNNLKKSLKRFGFVQPVVINKSQVVIGGHQRIKAWQELGNATVPTLELNLNEKEEKTLNLALNKISGEWDINKLYEVINEIRTDELLDFTGFDEREISQILDTNVEIEDEENLEEMLEKAPAKVKRGDIYKLGEHLLMCGDSTDQEDVKKLIGNNAMDMVFTDPPYNVDYKGRGKDTSEGIKNDSMSPEEFEAFIGKTFENMRESLKLGGVFYICSGWSSFPTFNKMIKTAGMYFAGVIIWVKNTAGMGWNDYRYQHEWIGKGRKNLRKKKGTVITYGWKKGNHQFYGERDETDVWEMPRKAVESYLHPTEKPDWLIMRALKNSSKFKDKVLDLFGGSGSTLIACEKLGRQAFIMELDERFCDVIIHRYEKHTKKEAVKL